MHKFAQGRWRAGQGQPADAITAGPLDLGQAIESQAGNFLRELRQRHEFRAVIDDLVIDFVGKQQQAVAFGDGARSLQAGRADRPHRWDCSG